MGYSTETTEWPAIAMSTEAKTLIETFFTLMDDPSDGVGDKLADEIFTHDGILCGGLGVASGTTEIRKCRQNAWDLIKVRHHVVKKVYVHDKDAMDLMLIGSVEMVLENEKSISGEFTARIFFSNGINQKKRIQAYQVWSDSAPMREALQAGREQ
ncbi:hypothetical protein EDB80DRAFT_457706 [Ilyonectria destructans]|nr:hypothetical protein EDB80DRAFT_457706 [Ilyonectria destructans]